MRKAAAALVAFCVIGAQGCAQNPLVLQGQVQTLQQQQLALAQQNQELQGRAAALDQDNQELGTLLAQARQQAGVLEDQVAALRDQLGSSAAQLARQKEERQEVEKKSETLAASVKRRAGATITANSSLRERLPAVDIPGVEVRADGDVIRLELPGGRLFESGQASLLPQATALIDSVAAEIARAYPEHLVGIEGHTDSDPIRAGPWRSNHQLSVARAMAVYEYLAGRTRLAPRQLFVVGHGANHPVVSNGTQAGKQRNRRVELVIYPERLAAR
ncbi:MAG: OmpA family protein [Pirellulales bacterium]